MNLFSVKVCMRLYICDLLAAQLTVYCNLGRIRV